MQVLNLEFPAKAASNLPVRKSQYNFDELAPDTNQAFAELVNKADGEDHFNKIKSRIHNAASSANAKRVEAAKAAGEATFSQLMVRVIKDHPEYPEQHVIGVWAKTSDVSAIKQRAPRKAKAADQVPGTSGDTTPSAD